jgi:hypothetical protein
VEKIIYTNEEGIVFQIIPTGEVGDAIKDVPTGLDYQIVDIDYEVIHNLTPLQIRNAALADISYTRPSDGAEIQVRHPDYASDYLMMKEAYDNMGSGDVEGWIDINNNPITMTKQDFADAMSHNRSEIKVIFATYIAKL